MNARDDAENAANEAEFGHLTERFRPLDCDQVWTTIPLAKKRSRTPGNRPKLGLPDGRMGVTDMEEDEEIAG